MRLSKNFSLGEFTKSNTASRLGLSNIPNKDHVGNLKTLTNFVLQPLREGFNFPINISSGYRGELLNTAIGGSKTSDHCFGKAADLDNDQYRKGQNADIFFFIKENLSFDQLIWEFGDEESPSWVHVSYRSLNENRGQILVAYKDDNNKTQYKLY